jgi:predicted acetyltransferase
MIDITLHRGEPPQREALANLAQLYIHDFTDFLRPARLDVGEDGCFADEIGMEDYWTKPDHSVWFIRAGEKLAGFALLNRKAPSGKPADFNMAQFFVMRQYRGLDVASRAVAQILNSHPGQWEVAIMEGNRPALRFWPKAVARARISQFESHEHVGENPARTLLRFVVS